MRITFLLTLLLLGCLCPPSWAETTPNSGVNNVETPPEGQDTAGDPVGVIDGSVLDAAVDIRVECPGIDIVFKRAYGSWSTREGDLGYGWSHSFEWRLEADGKGGYTLYAEADPFRAGTGEVYKFPALDADGESISKTGDMRLHSVGEGGHVVTSRGGVSHSFDSSGRLVLISSPGGVSIHLERRGGRVVRAVHDCGKALEFEYVNGRVSAVSVSGEDVLATYEYGGELSDGWPSGDVSGGESDVKELLRRVIVHDGGRAATNEYVWTRSPMPGNLMAAQKKVLPMHFAPSARIKGKRGFGGDGALASGNGCVRVVPNTFVPHGNPHPTGALMSRPSWMDNMRPILESKIDANGISTRYEYIRPDDGPAVKCAHTMMSDGLFNTHFDFDGGKTTFYKALSSVFAKTEVAYDSARRETLRQTGDEIVEKTYDGRGDMVREVSTNAATGAFAVRTAAYGEHRECVESGFALGGEPASSAHLEWDDEWRIPRRVVTPAGRVREWTREGNVLTLFGAGTNDPRGVLSFACSTNWLPLEVTDADGGRIVLSYDASNYVSRIAMDGMPAIDLTRDAMGRVASMALPGPDGARMTTLLRNARGRPLRIDHPDGTFETFAYDGNGWKKKVHVDALGRTDIYDWTLGLPIRAARVVNGVTNNLWSVKHDPQLNVVEVTDPLGRAAETYELDANERVVSATNLEGQRMERTYLLDNLASSETRFDGSTVSYSYDSNANIAYVDYPDATLAFTHDADGLLTSASNSVGIVSNEYDSATGWLVSSHGADGSLVSYAYHLGGGVASMASLAGVVSNTLDVAGRKDKLFTPAGEIGFGYCSWNGKLSVVTNANGTITSHAYDVMDRITNITWSAADGSRIGGFSYVYDTLGRIVSRGHDLGTNIFNRSYVYDAMDRLAFDGNVSYAYDAADNRIAKTGDVEGDISYTLGPGNRLQSWTGGSYTYNDAGCVTRIERVGKLTLDLTWNAQYQLVSVATNGVFAEGYAYDALGRRVTTTTLEGSVRHVYDNNWQCIADVDVNGNVLCSYVWGDGIDNLLAVKIGNEVYTALSDIQGTIWGFTDASGDVVARCSYDAWGNVLSSDVTFPALASLRYRFQGREWSAVTGLTDFRMRWYDALAGRWLSKDPIRLEGGINQYAFCQNLPNGFIDSFGLDVWIGQRWPHRNINVGDPKSGYTSFSFGLDDLPRHWYQIFNPFNESGIYYIDDPPDEVLCYSHTSKKVDDKALEFLYSLIGQTDTYRLNGANCRDFSKFAYDFITKELTQR